MFFSCSSLCNFCFFFFVRNFPFPSYILCALMDSTVNNIWWCDQTIYICTRRKTTRTKYDPPYIKKPIIKGAGNSNHVSVEEVSLDGSNKLITYGNQFRYETFSHLISFSAHKFKCRPISFFSLTVFFLFNSVWFVLFLKFLRFLNIFHSARFVYFYIAYICIYWLFSLDKWYFKFCFLYESHSVCTAVLITWKHELYFKIFLLKYQEPFFNNAAHELFISQLNKKYVIKKIDGKKKLDLFL